MEAQVPNDKIVLDSGEESTVFERDYMIVLDVRKSGSSITFSNDNMEVLYGDYYLTTKINGKEVRHTLVDLDMSINIISI